MVEKRRTRKYMGTTHQKKDFSYDEYLELLNQGKTKTEIIKHFGMARCTFYKRLKEKEGTTGGEKKNNSVEVPDKSADVLDNMKKELLERISSANLSDAEAKVYLDKASDLFCELDELVSKIQLASIQSKTRAMFTPKTGHK